MDYAFSSRDNSAEDLATLFAADVLAFDVESTGLHVRADVPIGFSVTDSFNHAYYARIENAYFRQLLADNRRVYIAHNAKFDRAQMAKAGVMVDNVCDTMIAAHLCEEPALSLQSLVLGKTGRAVRAFSELARPLIDMSTEELLAYSGPHARAAWILWFGYKDDTHFWPGYEYELRRNILWDLFWDLEMPLVPVLSDMELNGVMIDGTYLADLGRYLSGSTDLLEEVLAYWTGGIKINFNSPDQVAKLFYKDLGIKSNWKTTQKGRPTVEGEYLEKIKGSHPILPVYLKYKELQKLRSTYVDSILARLIGSRLYGLFNQTGTRTGRLSSSEPNLQNIPVRTELGRKIRKAFIAKSGFTLVRADADQLELKMMACWSKDPYMLGAFREGRDIHLETALRAYGDPKRRFDGKTLNFQTQYGGGSDADKAAFYGAYPGVLTWTKKTQAEARELGYVRTLFKRRRTIPEVQSSNDRLREHGGREAVSTIIQGSSAEVVKVGMRGVWEDIRGTEIKMVLQVHDELVFEVPDGVVEEFTHYLGPRLKYDGLNLPITYTISCGKNWAEMEEVHRDDQLT